MCITCDIIARRIIPPGGIVDRTDHIILHHCLDVEIPGYLILSPIRHVASIAALNAAEAGELIRTMRQTVAALETLPEEEKVYICSFGEVTNHFHVHLFPCYHPHSPYAVSDPGDHDGAMRFSRSRAMKKVDPNKLVRQEDILNAVALIKAHLGFRR